MTLSLSLFLSLSLLLPPFSLFISLFCLSYTINFHRFLTHPSLISTLHTLSLSLSLSLSTSTSHLVAPGPELDYISILRPQDKLPQNTQVLSSCCALYPEATHDAAQHYLLLHQCEFLACGVGRLG